MKMRYLLIILLLGVVSCQQPSYHWSTIQDVNNYIEVAPDSALTVLSSINSEDLNTEEEKATYALLLTMALDKNHITIKNDSLISFATEYFAKVEDRENTMISNYYQGRVKFMNEDYALGLVSFIRSTELARELDMKFWIGMSCRGISDIYHETYNATDELIYAKEEFLNMKQSGRQPYINYALLDLARAYCSNKEYDITIKYAKQAIDSANIMQDRYLDYAAMQLIGLSYLAQEQYNEAISVYESICQNEFATSRDSTYLSLVYAEDGNLNEAKKIIEILSTENDIVSSMSKYRVFKELGMTVDALKELEYCHFSSNTIIRDRLNISLNNSLVSYYDLNKQKTDEEIKLAHTRTWLIIIISFLLIGIIVSLMLYFVFKQRQQINDKVLFAEQLQEMLAEGELEKSKSASTIKSLLASKYDLLEELCDIVIRCSDTKSSKQRIVDAVTNLIESLSVKSNRIIELEKEVNSLYNNVISDFKQDLPNLKEADYNLFLFTILGLSNTAISLFLKEEKVNSVYDRKRRLKDKIKKLDDRLRERYMALFK